MNYGSQVGSHNFVFVIVFVKKPSSLRYFRAKAQVEDFMQISETIFRDNALYPTPLTPIFLVGIFFVLNIGGLRFIITYPFQDYMRLFPYLRINDRTNATLALHDHSHQSWHDSIEGVLFSMLDIMEFREVY